MRRARQTCSLAPAAVPTAIIVMPLPQSRPTRPHPPPLAKHDLVAADEWEPDGVRQRVRDVDGRVFARAGDAPAGRDCRPGRAVAGRDVAVHHHHERRVRLRVVLHDGVVAGELTGVAVPAKGEAEAETVRARRTLRPVRAIGKVHGDVEVERVDALGLSLRREQPLTGDKRLAPNEQVVEVGDHGARRPTP